MEKVVGHRSWFSYCQLNTLLVRLCFFCHKFVPLLRVLNTWCELFFTEIGSVHDLHLTTLGGCFCRLYSFAPSSGCFPGFLFESCLFHLGYSRLECEIQIGVSWHTVVPYSCRCTWPSTKLTDGVVLCHEYWVLSYLFCDNLKQCQRVAILHHHELVSFCVLLAAAKTRCFLHNQLAENHSSSNAHQSQK